MTAYHDRLKRRISNGEDITTTRAWFCTVMRENGSLKWCDLSNLERRFLADYAMELYVGGFKEGTTVAELIAEVEDWRNYANGMRLSPWERCDPREQH
jgi:hypothetical protein